ncbi:MAG: beta-N-acetylhexosaminidase [Bacteroidia bacterium]|nr:beta-N-acetylhexosaminidase [Bacteroidia bacterium]
MKQFSTHTFLGLLLSGTFIVLLSCKPSGPKTDLTKETIIPKPVSVTATGDRFSLTDDSNIYVEGDELKQIGQYLANKLNPSTGFDLQVTAMAGEPPSGNIYLTTAGADTQLGEEGYELTITEDLIKLSAPKPAGLFRGIQTIRQILPSKIEFASIQQGPWEIASGTIRDYPTYSWRGSMLDVARHFFSVEDVKRYIDLIAFYKMNIMHLHLSDDQGWRIEIKSWPNLTTIGGSTEVGGGKGGFYTQEQYSDIVNYALSQFITIVPEIDLPGHINSALASYGELNGGTIVPIEGRVKMNMSPKNDLGKKNRPTELYMGTEVGWSTLRVEKEITFKFVDDVLRELAALTPGPYLHIGGDEAHVTKKEDYITFVNRFDDMVKSYGKVMVGWEEIAQGEIDSNAIVQHWSSPKYALMAAEKGSKIIMSPAKKAYLDMQYDSTSRIGLHWAAYIEVDSAYNWDPAIRVDGIPQEIILGVEAPLWSETVTNMDDIEYLAFPRLPGYAEIGWSSSQGRTWDEYKVRLGKHGERMRALNIDFYRSKLVPWVE